MLIQTVILDFPILTFVLHRCTCPDGYTGPTCAEDVNECLLDTGASSNICNNGICRNLPGSFECFCRPGYSGSLCNHEFDECLSNPCLVSSFPRPPSFDISNTLTSPSCFQHGSCTNLVNNYRCDCLLGFNGEQQPTAIRKYLYPQNHSEACTNSPSHNPQDPHCKTQ